MTLNMIITIISQAYTCNPHTYNDDNIKKKILSHTIVAIVSLYNVHAPVMQKQLYI